MFGFLRRWKDSGKARLELDYLLSSAHPELPLRVRVDWLVELLQWIRSPGTMAVQGEGFQSGQMQATRVRYFLLTLEKHPEWKPQVAATLRSILREMTALDLFCTTGLPAGSGFVAEAAERLLSSVLPRPPRENDLGEIFTSLFSSSNDVRWLLKLEDATIDEIWSLFSFGMGEGEEHWNNLRRDLEDAFLFLSGQVRALGLDPKLRARMPKARIRDLAFFEITFFAHQFLLSLGSNDPVMIGGAADKLAQVIARCRVELEQVLSHLDSKGVSIAIVYEIDRIEALLKRLTTLKRILAGRLTGSRTVVEFISSLILEASNRRSLLALFRENLGLLSRKIAERSAETGDHYIARTRAAYWMMFRKAAGGGFLTAFTALIKVLTDTLPVAYFIKGLLASINYAGSFVLIQLAGFTLGTKQPAMTANALAARMQDLSTQEKVEALVDEVAHLIRSQVAAVAGNVYMVVPTVLGLDFLIRALFGHSILGKEEGAAVLQAHSLIGPSFLYAAFTGLLLWASAIAAGWIDNWSTYREIPEALAHNRRLQFFIGSTRLRRWADSYRRNLAGVAGNVSLGFMLGLSPKILGFLGFPLDVRHVTLSSAMVAFGAISQGVSVLRDWNLWLAVLGIGVIGLLNIGVAFGMAMFVALRARKLTQQQREIIYYALARRFRDRPLSFLRPKKETPTSG